ncbi:hypothetical protein [Pelomonas cellulosilytica]|uniref:Uncharacterized protein n=1 Tax=Pelomonas cellulosilytica TaxID=2906762 RepID=A0ABS8Y110_9BURK|nr:hypothetical protein [Pelomonas sp. P8]MCE4557313.1 hypothetical protein [Pelomonas sp. P8]
MPYPTAPAFVPAKTDAARQLLAGPRGGLSAPLRMLLINVDGRRGLDELRRLAHSLGLADEALETLHRDGLITGRRAAAPRPDAAPPATAPAPAPVAPPVAAPAADPAADLRRLMRAKMFALDLASRMLAGRDAELRASARVVDSESRFLVWMAEASARIEAAASADRAQLFRERVAQVAG